MKDIRSALCEFLLGDSTVSSLVGTKRIFPAVLPQGTNDTSVVYNRVSGQGDYDMQGATGLVRPRLQIDAWAVNPDDASALANAIKARIDGYKGVMGTGGAAVTVQGVFMAGEREDYNDQVKMHRMSRDYFFHMEEL